MHCGALAVAPLVIDQHRRNVRLGSSQCELNRTELNRPEVQCSAVDVLEQEEQWRAFAASRYSLINHLWKLISYHFRLVGQSIMSTEVTQSNEYATS